MASHQAQQLYLIEEISDQCWRMIEEDGKGIEGYEYFQGDFNQAPIIYKSGSIFYIS